MITIDELWNSSDSQLWKKALHSYWEYVKPSNLALERKLEQLDLAYLRTLDARGWYDFLRDQYFRWKFTASNRYVTTTNRLRRYIEDGSLDELHNIKLQLLSLNPADIAAGLNRADEIRGLGIAGASGLLALMYPRFFGTVDQFAVKALREVKALPEANMLKEMNEESLKDKDGVILIRVMQRKAAEINRLFRTEEWTPRKIDKILWTYGRRKDPLVDSPRAAGDETSVQGNFQSSKQGEPEMNNHEMMAMALKG